MSHHQPRTQPLRERGDDNPRGKDEGYQAYQTRGMCHCHPMATKRHAAKAVAFLPGPLTAFKAPRAIAEVTISKRSGAMLFTSNPFPKGTWLKCQQNVVRRRRACPRKHMPVVSSALPQFSPTLSPSSQCPCQFDEWKR